MTRQRILVIGGVAAGPAAAAEAHRTDPEADIVLYEQGRTVSYAACELPYLVSGRVSDPGSLVRHTPAQLETTRGFHVEILQRLEAIDPSSSRIRVKDLASESVREERYDRLILATGARASDGGVRDLHGPGVSNLRTLEDGIRLAEAMTAVPGIHVAVLGGGLVGLEVASELAASGKRVTVLDPAGPAAAHLEPELVQVLDEALLRAGIAVRRERATAIRRMPGSAPVVVMTDRGELVGARQVVSALGLEPATQIGAAAGLKLGVSGAYRVDETLRTSVRGIWACGDCVEVPRLPDGKNVFAPLAPTAFRTARVAGHNAARRGRSAEHKLPRQAVAYAASIAGLEIASVGMTLRAASAAGFDALHVSVKHTSASSLHANSTRLHAVLVFDRSSGLLLGGQFVGRSGAAARANVVVAALHAGASVRDLHEFDFIYAPPLAPSLDILTIAAGAAQKALGRR